MGAESYQPTLFDYAEEVANRQILLANATVADYLPKSESSSVEIQSPDYASVEYCETN